LTYVSAVGAAQFTGAASARGERGAELQSKGKHGGNSFRLEPGNCHQLSIPHVMTAYSKWAANQITAKKAPFWVFFEELKKAAGTYPPRMEMCWVTPSRRCCAGFVRAKEGRCVPPSRRCCASFVRAKEG